MSSVLQQSEEKIWYWNKKPKKLKDLTDGQLYSIKQTLMNSKANWFGQKRDYWLNAINPILKSREERNIAQILVEMDKRRKLKISSNLEKQLHEARSIKLAAKVVTN